MKQTIEELQAVIERTPDRLRKIGEAESGVRPEAGEWSRKEILGHLIDSASNNHQRFVRAQLTDALLAFPDYAQDGWVQVQGYQQTPWQALVELWAAYNRHLLHLMRHVNPDTLERRCKIGNDQPVSLAFLMQDYVRHLKHHLQQILSD